MGRYVTTCCCSSSFPSRDDIRRDLDATFREVHLLQIFFVEGHMNVRGGRRPHFRGWFLRHHEGRLDVTIHIGPCSILSQLGYDTRQPAEGTFRGILPNLHDLVAI